MAIKTLVTDLAQVPAEVRGHYTKTKDGSFALVLDGEPAGYVKADKLAEFRANNRALNAAKTELEAKLKAYDGLDPDAARAALAELAETDIVDQDEVERTQAAAVDKARAELAAQHATALADLEAQLGAERTAHAASQFKAAIAVEFLRAGGRESAVDFMVGKAGDVFAWKDGKLATDQFSTARPGEPLSVEEWLGQQATVADFAFRPSRGGGAGGGGTVVTKRTIAANDPLEFGRNIEAIIAGDVNVE